MIDKKIKNREDCMGCSACYNVCPQNCISMVYDNEGFEYPEVDDRKCIECGLCVKVCPIINKNEVNGKEISQNDIKAYACINKDESIRLESSSGGIFTLIAEQILNQGGVVFGVGFDENFKVEHSHVESYDELGRFRGSKYVQSKIGDTYKKTKDFLDQGRAVLFTGTPCQISGLKGYLGKDYDNLLCQDIICQGVPSPLVWELYLESRVKRQGYEGKVDKISFRCKDKGWQNYKMKIRFQSGNSYIKSKDKDGFMKAFMNFLSIRPSCFQCKFKGKKRNSDITLGDFWRIENVEPLLNDNNGTSLVLVNTSKGQVVFDQLENLIEYKEVKFVDSIKYNPMYSKSVPKNHLRETFFLRLNSNDFNLLVNRYIKENIFKITFRKLKSLYLKVRVK